MEEVSTGASSGSAYSTASSRIHVIDALLRQIESDDPDLVELRIGHGRFKSLSKSGEWQRLGDSIGKNTCLRELDFSIWDIVTWEGEEDLKKFFIGLSANTSLQKMHLGPDCCADLYEEVLSVLGPFFKANNNLRELDISEGCDVGCTSTEVWRNVFTALCQSCTLEKLSLSRSLAETNDVTISSLTQALPNLSSLKTLDLEFYENVPMATWHALFECLWHPSCQLVEIGLARCSLNNESIISLSDSLIRNTSLKKLALCDDKGITLTGWRALSRALQNRNSSLEYLELSSNMIDMIDDEGMNVLAVGISNNNLLKELHVNGNEEVTHAGWESFAAVLRNRNSALEKVNLSNNYLGDDTLSSFANAIADNSVLKELLVGDQIHDSDDSTEAFLSVLCNTSSIMATHQSNHTLQRICEDDDSGLSDDLRDMLRINKENSKIHAARLKIIKTHFREGYNVSPFVGMEAKVLPHAISWMAKKNGSDEVDGNFYCFLKEYVACLFNNAADDTADLMET